MVIIFISEMIEHVGHEYMDDFFGCCEYHLAEHGLLVLQVQHFLLYDYDCNSLSQELTISHHVQHKFICMDSPSRSLKNCMTK
jgi:cyclopropane fatty-acyl-phospholipid synthase-like methyltransferase